MISTKFLAGAAALTLFTAPAFAQAPEFEPQAGQPAAGAPAPQQAPAGAATSTQPAAASAAPAGGALSFAAGGKVYDAQGGEVGTVQGVAGDVVTVDTGTNKVGVPKGSFAAGPKGPAIAMTKAELDAAATGAKQDNAQDMAAALVSGAQVKGPEGGMVGTIDKVEGDIVTIAMANGKVGVPKTAFALRPDGLVIGMTAAQLEAASKSAAASSGN